MSSTIEITTAKAKATGQQVIPDATIHIRGEQPADRDVEDHQAEARRIHHALRRSLPGGTLTALTGLLLAEIGTSLLRVPMFPADTLGG